MKNSEWIKHIDFLKNSNGKKGTKSNIFRALEKSIINKIPNEPFGILLSGGIDSSLIAKICKDRGDEFRCFCVGIKDSKDVEAATEVSQLLNLKLEDSC